MINSYLNTIKNDETKSGLNPAEQIWESHANRLADVVNLAYREWPLSSRKRTEIIAGAMKRAHDELIGFVTLTDYEKRILLLKHTGMVIADVAELKESVQELVGEWMHIFSEAISRAKGEA